MTAIILFYAVFGAIPISLHGNELAILLLYMQLLIMTDSFIVQHLTFATIVPKLTDICI